MIAPFLIDVESHANSSSARYYFKYATASSDEDHDSIGDDYDDGEDKNSVTGDVKINLEDEAEELRKNLKKFVCWVLETEDDKVTVKFVKHFVNLCGLKSMTSL